MKMLFARIKQFFFPPLDSPRWVKILPYAILGALTIILLAGSAYGWAYTNSPEFCGESCHTMPPEYTAYQVSPHARISCVECHIGRDFIATQFSRKAGDLRHVFYLWFKKYEFPITADDMRPARESCEKCHFPEKFSNDTLKELKSYGDDRNNTPSSLFLVLKTGGGSKRQGLGKGIHWHVENRILYFAPDRQQQVIPYVRVYNDDGTFTEYTDIEAGIDPDTIQEADLKEMDCITCHNRITHLVNQPEVSVDAAIQRQAIDISIPEIRLKSVEMLLATYTSEAQALIGIAALDEFYQTYYPDFYEANTEKIVQAIEVVKDIYIQSVYLEQKSDWNSHPNNIGHSYTPGCFRCHDGKHLNQEQAAIRLECNLCHSIPVVADTQDFITDIEISRGPEPDTHKNPNWISMHREVFDTSCSGCHDTDNPGGTDNTSFCSNSACHSNVWEFAGFDAPKLREVLQAQMPTPAPPVEIGSGPLTYNDTFGPLLTQRCGTCHGEGGMMGLNLTTYATLLSGGLSGPAISPGDSPSSIMVIKLTDPAGHFAQLNAEEIDLLRQWIDQGAPEKLVTHVAVGWSDPPHDYNPRPSHSLIHQTIAKGGDKKFMEEQIPIEEPEATLSRRKFLEIATVSIGGLMALGVAVPAVSYVVGTSLKKSGEQEWIRVGSASKVELGVPTLFKVKIKRQVGWNVTEEELAMYLITENGSDFLAISNICTHLGCRVRWITEDEQFFCPCHNAVFSKTGDVVAGPPPKPLGQFQVKVENDQLYILGG